MLSKDCPVPNFQTPEFPHTDLVSMMPDKTGLYNNEVGDSFRAERIQHLRDLPRVRYLSPGGQGLKLYQE
jgi:hypothetical protein